MFKLFGEESACDDANEISLEEDRLEFLDDIVELWGIEAETQKSNKKCNTTI